MKLAILFFLAAVVVGDWKNSVEAGCTCQCLNGDGSACGAATGDVTDDASCLQYCVSIGCASAGGNSNYALACSSDCLGGGSLLYSCTAGAYVAAREVKVGDKVRAISSDGGEPVCTDVYYAFHHPEASARAVTIEVQDEEGDIDTFQVSDNHLVYVGERFEDRVTVLAKHVKPGDVLISSKASGGTKVLSVESSVSDLVNILTFEPHLELKGGHVVSAYSYHQYLYPALFFPFRVIYTLFGAASFDYVKPTVDVIDTWIAQPLVGLAYE